MKKLIFMFAMATALSAVTSSTGCQSSAKKADVADAKVEDAKKDLKDAQTDATLANQKAADVEAWNKYRSESEIKIKDNETYIAALKTGMKDSGKKMDAVYLKSIDVLEQRNKDLKSRMEAYDKGQSNWESFQREFNHDMDELGAALKDLTVNNKK